MATMYAEPGVTAPKRLAAERRARRAWRTINENGWRERLAPLAEHMGTHAHLTLLPRD